MTWKNQHQTESTIIERLLREPAARGHAPSRGILEGIRNEDTEGTLHVFPDDTTQLADRVEGPDDRLKRS